MGPPCAMLRREGNHGADARVEGGGGGGGWEAREGAWERGAGEEEGKCSSVTELGYAQLESGRNLLWHLQQLVTHHQRHAQEKKAMQIALVLGCFAILKCSKECRLRH